MRNVLLMVAALMTLLGAARAADKAADAEKDLKRGQVPKAVLDAVTKKYPTAKLNKFGQEESDGKQIYEVELTNGPDEVSIDVSPEGKILAEETVIKSLPDPVKAGLKASRYGGWKITKTERVIHDENLDTPLYEVVVQSKKERFELVLDPTGKITKEEAKSPKDSD